MPCLQVMQLKMAKRLQSISSLALNHITLDTESDYDTDDMESTLTDTHKLKLSDGLTSIVNDSHRLKLKDLDSSEGEGLYDFDDGTIKRRTSKKKKRRGSKPLVLEAVEDKDSQVKGEEKEKDGASSGVSSAGSTSTETPSSSTSSSSHAVDCEPISNGDLLPASPLTPTTAKSPQTACDSEPTTATTTTTTTATATSPATTTSSLNGAPPASQPEITD